MRRPSLFLLAIALPLAASAGTAALSDPGKAVQPVECIQEPLDSLLLDTDYGFHQDLKRGSGNLEVQHSNIEFDRRIPLDFLTWPGQQCGQWFLRLGADYERFDFSIHNEDRLPDTLQSVSGAIALEYLVNGQAALFLQSRPGIYFQQRANAGAFDAPTTAAAALPLFGGDQFYLIAGAIYSGLGRYPVLPVGGILWHISPKWDLRAYLPDPRLVYQVSSGIELWAGAQVRGGAYKTDNRDVTPAKLSGAVLTYDQVRAGAGITWKAKPLTIDFGAGYTVQSEFDYSRAGESFSTHPAPYASLSARLDF